MGCVVESFSMTDGGRKKSERWKVEKAIEELRA